MRKPRVPKLCLHKPTGQGYVRLGGRVFYCGRYGSDEAAADYDRRIAEWLQANRTAPRTPTQAARDPHLPIVAEIAAAFFTHARAYYVKNGRATSEVHSIQAALKSVVRLFGELPAVDFGPKCLKLCRQDMIRRGRARTAINKHVHRIRRCFRWASEEELVPVSVYEALRTVAPLKRGRTEATETARVQPVPDADVDAVVAVASPTLAAMIRLQRLTGMRSGELVTMRTGDILRDGPVWQYVPREHKTEHHAYDRIIDLGPQAQAILQPFLRADPDRFIFSPRQSERDRREERSKRRATPLSCGNRRGTNRRQRPKRQPREQYTVDTYGQAIAYLCDQAFLPPSPLGPQDRETRIAWGRRLREDTSGKLLAELKAWRKGHRWHPHQLRHSAGTRVRAEYGLEAAKLFLGHHSLAVAEVYAEPNRQRCAEIALRIG